MPQLDKSFVRNTSDLKNSIVRFDRDWKNLSSHTPKVQHDLIEFVRRSRYIYAMQVGDQYLVCGGKLCAHRDLDAEQYSKYRSELKGWQARRHIRGWGDQVPLDHPAHEAWEALGALHSVQPAPSYVTFLVHDVIAQQDAVVPPVEDKVVNLIVELTAMLGPSSRDNLKRRIAAI